MNYLLEDFEKAINRLEEVLEKPKTAIHRDSAIKRFELCFDLAWKAIKNLAKEQGLECYSPRNCLQIGFQLKLINQPGAWLALLGDRNLTVHLYDEKQADEVYAKLPQHREMFKALLRALRQGWLET